MDEIKNTAVKKRKKKRSTNPAVRVLKILGTALLSIFLILIITCSIFATVLTIYVLNFADTTTTISLDKTETSNISRFLSVNPDYDEDDEDSYDEEVSHGYEWTEQDSWDALTDGMCGKMPSNPLEYDAMMDAMGY